MHGNVCPSNADRRARIYARIAWAMDPEDLARSRVWLRSQRRYSSAWVPLSVTTFVTNMRGG